MAKYRLLRSQKNAIFNALKSTHINHFDFDLEDTDEKFKLHHKDTNHYLEISYKAGAYNYAITYSPGDNVWEDSKRVDSWNAVFHIVESWARYLEGEASQPEYWDNIGQAPISLGSASEVENSVFSESERNDIRGKLNQIERFLFENYELSPESQRLVTNKLDGLEQLAESQGRIDWLHTAVGVAFTIVVGVGLAPTQAKEFAQFVGNLFSQIFGGTIPFLP